MYLLRPIKGRRCRPSGAPQGVPSRPKTVGIPVRALFHALQRLPCSDTWHHPTEVRMVSRGMGRPGFARRHMRLLRPINQVCISDRPPELASTRSGRGMLWQPHIRASGAGGPGFGETIPSTPEDISKLNALVLSSNGYLHHSPRGPSHPDTSGAGRISHSDRRGGGTTAI